MRRISPAVRVPTCDQSGLCEEVAAICAGRANPRLIARMPLSSVVVDIAPVAVGHVLVVADMHVSRRALLQRADRLDLEEAVNEARTVLEGCFALPTVAVEHGSGDRRGAGDCVRHCHVHVMPIAPVSESKQVALLEVVLDELKLGSVDDVGDDPRGYVSVRFDDATYWGQPREGVRHVARVILSLLAGADLALADWGLGIHNPSFRETLTRLQSGQLLRVG